MIEKEEAALVMAPAADYVQLLKQDLETALQSLPNSNKQEGRYENSRTKDLAAVFCGNLGRKKAV
jgi:hypothetical protein